jgi:S1-C subfamily serine protease
MATLHTSALCAALVGVALAAGACTGAPADGSPKASGSGSPSASTAPVTATSAPPSSSGQTGSDIPAVVQRVEPSVVTIITPNGLGSGVVYRKDDIVTNHHVVAVQEGSQQVFHHVKISYADGTESAGTVVASDLLDDLAVIRPARKNLPALKFNTQLPPAGETVLAIGSPLGFENTVTEGIVSGTGREVPGSGNNGTPLVDLIQTDAAISPGNSGGALLDTQGRVVGINEAYIPPNSGAVSIGFAIPSATVVDDANQLIETGHVSHPYLGVSVGRLTPQIEQALGLHVSSGAIVLGVQPGGPAAHAGVQAGDVITKLAGNTVSSVTDLLAELRKTKPGQRVQLTVVRSGQSKQLTITIGTRPS